MDVFKLKISIDNSTIELEGNGDLVFKIFTELRDTGLGKIININYKTTKNAPDAIGISASNQDLFFGNDVEITESMEAPKFPELKDFVIMGNPATEAEWVLVYAYYQSEFGTGLFTKDNLRDKYKETNRYTTARSKNFVTNFNILISNSYIASVNEVDYKMTENGKQKAQSIILKNNTSENIKKKKQPKSFTKDKYNIVAVDLSDSERLQFREFYIGFGNISNIDKAVLISYWLKQNKNNDEIDKDIMFTMLRTAKANTSFDIKGALKNAKNVNKYYVNGEETGKYKLHHIGEDYVTNILMKKASQK